MTFKPKLINHGTLPEVATLKAVVSGCTAIDGATETPFAGRVIVKLKATSNNCGDKFSDDANQTKAVPETVAWKASPKIAKSATTFGVADVVTVGTGAAEQVQMSFGGSGTTGTGSYPGTDGGASSTATFMTTGTVGNKIAAGCTSSSKSKPISKVTLGSIQITDS